MSAVIRVKDDEKAVSMSEQLIRQLGGVDAALTWFLEIREQSLASGKEHLLVRAWGWMFRLLKARDATGRQVIPDAEPDYVNDVNGEEVVEAVVKIAVESMAKRASFCEMIILAAVEDHPEIRPAIRRALDQAEAA
jgi:hypothetical protein